MLHSSLGVDAPREASDERTGSLLGANAWPQGLARSTLCGGNRDPSPRALPARSQIVHPGCTNPATKRTTLRSTDRARRVPGQAAFEEPESTQTRAAETQGYTRGDATLVVAGARSGRGPGRRPGARARAAPGRAADHPHAGWDSCWPARSSWGPWWGATASASRNWTSPRWCSWASSSRIYQGISWVLTQPVRRAGNAARGPATAS